MPMLQAASNHLIIPEPSEDLLTNEPWSIEVYADGLMNELFADLDEILDFNLNLPSQTVKHGSRKPPRSQEKINPQEQFHKLAKPSTSQPEKYEQLQTINVPQIVLPSTLNRTQQVVPQPRNQQLSTVVVETPSVTPVSQKHQKTKRAIGKLLILGASIGVAIAGTIYLIQSGVLLLLTSRLTQPIYVPQPHSQLPTQVDVEADLVDYMLAALTIIDKQSASNNQQPLAQGLSNRAPSNPNAIAFANTLPPVAANNTPLIPNRSSNVVERIYIPVYQAPSPMRYAPPPIPGTPKLIPPVATKTSQPNIVKTTLNQVRQAAKPVGVKMFAGAVRSELKSLPVRTAPITLRQPSSPLSVPVVPFGAAPPNQTSETAPASQQQAYLPTSATEIPRYTLQGLMKSDDKYKSAALFEVDGVTHRINVGESIGSSGWTLVEVSNGEVVVRRNGEARSIYAGQKL